MQFFADDEAIGSATTASDGTASLKPPRKYQKGSRTFTATFAGDDYYHASSGTTRT
ncbi:MAG: Ig-like domain-containing protein [Actinomycetota bacterium]|nr:Ig-like domain-containing protein [Actinomycetota bacterium]